jgi:hypothetical protein
VTFGSRLPTTPSRLESELLLPIRLLVLPSISTNQIPLGHGTQQLPIVVVHLMAEEITSVELSMPEIALGGRVAGSVMNPRSVCVSITIPLS